MVGIGKSTIARTIAQSFTDKNCLGANFFFKRSKDNHSTASRLFNTIATDLITRLPDLISTIRKVVDADLTISEKALKDQYEKFILQLFLEIR